MLNQQHDQLEWVLWYAPWLSDQLEWVLWYAPWLSDQLEWICGMLHGLVINWSSSAIETSRNRVNVTPRASALAGCDKCGGKFRLNEVLDNRHVKQISTLASRIGKLVIMDADTAGMCHLGVARHGYARVMVEVNAKKQLPIKIDVAYKNRKNEIIGNKMVQVIYNWKPPSCKDCRVFGHNHDGCPKNVPNKVKKDVIVDNGFSVKQSNKGFTEMESNRKYYQTKQNAVPNDGNLNMDKGSGMDDFKSIENVKEVHPKKNSGGSKQKKKRISVVQESNRNKNQFEVLREYEESENYGNMEMLTREKVNMRMSQKKQPLLIETTDSTNDMAMKSLVLIPMCFKTANKVVVVFLYFLDVDVRIVCAALETHLKSKKLVKACNKAFGDWDWITNVTFGNKGCRIIVGWNKDMDIVRSVHMTD
ncbi:RNA-directed DNA polymerase, eukaryota, reverse transcriptase zinc-binding domain protein [Tanacetum coccineum]